MYKTKSLTGSDNSLLRVPRVKRLRIDDDGQYFSPSPGPSSPSQASDAGTSRSVSPYTVSPSPQPSPLSQPDSTPVEFEWNDIRTRTLPEEISNIEGDEHNAQTRAENEVCFGMISCLCDSSQAIITATKARHSERTFALFLPLTVVPPATEDGKLVLCTDDGAERGTVAAALRLVLVPLLLQSLVRIQGVTLLPLAACHSRTKNPKFEVYLNVFGSEDVAAPVGQFLSDNSVFLQHPKFPEAGFPYQNPHVISRRLTGVFTACTLTGGIPIPGSMKQSASYINTEEATDLLDFFNNISKAAILGEVSGDLSLKTELLSHQKQGLYFLQRREQGLSVFDTASVAIGKPICNIKGGILADSMGLGKTLSILSLIASTLEEARRIDSDKAACSPRSTLRSRVTLIVAPVSTLGNWEEQIATHIRPKTLRYLVYHGNDRPRDLAILCKYDIILTTFSVVSLEWQTERNPLHAIEFFRVVIDEAHEIRMEKTRRSQAICALATQRRWAVTGTPLQNDLWDIATLFKFLRYEPMHTTNGFKRYVFDDAKSGIDNLRSALKAVCLRRTKDALSGLPPRTENVMLLDFTTGERVLYDGHKSRLSQTHRSGTGAAKTLKCLLNLRMICDHGYDLLSPSRKQSPCSAASTCVVCSQALIGDTQFERMGCPHQSICAECIELLPPSDSRLGECDECSTTEAITPEKLPVAQHECFQHYRGPSTKVRALLQAIRSESTGGGNSPKHVVFSIWTRMLDLIGRALKDSGVRFYRLDGSMSRLRRDEALRMYQDDRGCVVILVSLMAGGVGINLTCASRVHLMEPHWNPMVELQALDRVHRLGQTREVVITRYVIRDTFENDMIKRQRKKLELARQCLEAGKAHIMKYDVKKEIMECLIESV